MNEAMSKRIKGLYKAPFKLCPYNIYVFDAANEMIADFMPLEKNPSFRPRGFGRMKYLLDGDALHDACEKFFLGLLRECSTEPIKCIDILNRAWASDDSFKVALLASGVTIEP